MKLEHADSEAIAHLSETVIEAKLNKKNLLQLSIKSA